VPRQNRPELVAAAAAVALLALVEWLGQRATNELAETARWVAHSHEVVSRVEQLALDVTDAESVRRGFALTGDASVLPDFHAASNRARSDFGVLRDLTRDNPRQLARLEGLETKVEERLAFLAAAVEERRVGFDPAAEADRTRRGNALRATLRAGIDELLGEERSLLAARERDSQESLRRASIVQIAGTAVSLLLFGFAVLRLRRENRLRRASEAQLRDRERSLATTLYSIADGFLSTDADGRIERMNHVAEQLTGYRLEEARGRSYREVFRLVHESSAKEVVNPVTQALAGDVAEIVDEAVLLAKDGTRRRVSDTAAPIRDADGTLLGAIVVFRDITQPLEDARALRRANVFLDSVVENLPLMLFVKEANELSFVRLNRAGEELLGMKREDLVGKTDFAFFPVEEAKAFIENDRKVLREKQPVETAEEPLTTASGVRWLHTRKVPILGEEGDPEYLLGISEDITDRRRADVELRAARDAAETASRELEAFSYSVAHDLRAPLRSIDGFSQALLEDQGDRLDDEGKEYLARVRRSAQRMGELIDDLLSLARVSRSDFARATVDVSAIARDVGEHAKADRNPRATLVVQEGLVTEADPRLLKILLENLLSNALKFSAKRDNARVEVGAADAKGRSTFFVRDNGAGFDVAAAKKLFSAFQRYHRPTEYEGTGIGLATAERIVSRHGGRIWAESTPGEGATFFFTLSRGEPAA